MLFHQFEDKTVKYWQYSTWPKENWYDIYLFGIKYSDTIADMIALALNLAVLIWQYQGWVWYWLFSIGNRAFGIRIDKYDTVLYSIIKYSDTKSNMLLALTLFWVALTQ